jgi:ABC-2 family transporter protein
MIRRVLRLVRFEWQKLFSRRFTWIALALVVAAAALAPALGHVAATAEAISQRRSASQDEFQNGWTALASGLRLGTYVATFVLLILAGSSIGEEAQQGTLKTLFLRPVRRVEVLLAKKIALAAFAVFLVLAMVLVAGAVGLRSGYPLVSLGLLFSCAIDHPGHGTGATIGGYFLLATVAGLVDRIAPFVFVKYVGLSLDELYDIGGAIGAASKELRTLAPAMVIVPFASSLVFMLGAALLLRMRDVAD